MTRATPASSTVPPTTPSTAAPQTELDKIIDRFERAGDAMIQLAKKHVPRDRTERRR